MLRNNGEDAVIIPNDFRRLLPSHVVMLTSSGNRINDDDKPAISNRLDVNIGVNTPLIDYYGSLYEHRDIDDNAKLQRYQEILIPRKPGSFSRQPLNIQG